MSILGRKIKKSCKFCVDSIGEEADISCGDYWYLGEDGKPSFEDRDGRNCIFTWTNVGNELLEELISMNRIMVERDCINTLKLVQPNHYNRRSTIIYKYVAMKMLFRQVPPYSLDKMRNLAKNTNIKTGFNIFKGTVKRILQGKI